MTKEDSIKKDIERCNTLIKKYNDEENSEIIKLSKEICQIYRNDIPSFDTYFDRKNYVWEIGRYLPITLSAVRGSLTNYLDDLGLEKEKRESEKELLKMKLEYNRINLVLNNNVSSSSTVSLDLSIENIMSSPEMNLLSNTDKSELEALLIEYQNNYNESLKEKSKSTGAKILDFFNDKGIELLGCVLPFLAKYSLA